MNKSKSSSYLQQFSWEEWDNQMIAVLYRSNRRFVVKQYVERILANSSQWQQFVQASFFNIEPITRAYTMTQNEVKLMRHIFSWHLNGTLNFPIIGGLDQLLDWEDLLDFIERAKQASTNQFVTINSCSTTALIPVGISSSTILKKQTNKRRKNFKSKQTNFTSNQQRILVQQHQTSSFNSWIQINNICLPYLIKSQQIYLLPYQILLDCDLLNEHEQSFLQHFTFKANSNDIQYFEKIISSSIDFILNNDLLLIDLYYLIFGLSKIVYVKFLNQQHDVNKSYKTVLAQSGGIIILHSHSIPFIRLDETDYILLNSLISILHLSTKVMSILRQHSVSARSHEIDYLRLVQFYQRKHNDIVLNQQQFIVTINEIRKYMIENELIIDMLLTQYQQNEYQKLKKQTENRPRRKPTKRQTSKVMTEVQNMTIE